MRARRGWIGIGLLLACGSICLAQPARANDSTSERVCDQPFDPGHPWTTTAVMKQFGDQVRAGRPGPAYAFLLRGLRSSPNQVDQSVKLLFEQRVRELLNGTRSPDHFSVSKTFDLTAGLLHYIFERPPEGIDLTDCAGKKSQLDELRYLANAIENIGKLSQDWSPFANGIVALETSYDRYLFEGFPMFPWEALANSALANKHLADGPPRSQLVLFHPALGVEINADSFDQSQASEVLSLNLLGWIHYPEGGEYRSYWGLSVLGTLRDDAGAGLGVAAHYKNFSLGATWRDDDAAGTAGDGPYVFMGIDLYQYVSDKNKQAKLYKKNLDQMVEDCTAGKSGLEALKCLKSRKKSAGGEDAPESAGE